jgi:hypothetical protein
MIIEIIKNKLVLIDGKKWGNKPNNMDIGDYILTLLFYMNKNGNNPFEIILDGVNETKDFQKEVKRKYLNIKNTVLRDQFYLYANIK